MLLPNAEVSEYIPSRGDAELAEIYNVIQLDVIEGGQGKKWTFTDDMCEGTKYNDANELARSIAGRLRVKYPASKGIVKISQRDATVHVHSVA